MGLGLGGGLRLGLEPVPRLARSSRPKWSGGLGTVGPPAALGVAAAVPTAVGARCSADVEPDRQWLGILEQQNMDSDLNNFGSRDGAGSGRTRKLHYDLVEGCRALIVGHR